jgi:hypothetical protein
MLQEHNKQDNNTFSDPVAHPDNGGGTLQELMTEEELIAFLRIPLISKTQNHGYVIENLKRMHDLPCIHICKKPLYPLNAVRKWIEDKLLKEQR